MKHSTGRTVIILVITAAFFAGSVVTSKTVVDIRGEDQRLSSKMFHIPMAGFESVVADILWIRLIQYMGSYYAGVDEREEWANDLYRKFDNLTRLDPSFTIAYQYGVLFLSVDAPEKALILCDRGLTHIPPDELDWKLPLYGAFISYQYSREANRFERSMKYLEGLMKLKDCPSFVPRFHARVVEKQGSAKMSLEVWHKLYKSSEAGNRSIVASNLRRMAEDVLAKEEEPELKEKARFILGELERDVR